MDARELAMYNQGLILLQQHDWSGAAEQFHALLTLNPGLAQPYCTLAYALNKQENVQDALEMCRKATSINPHLALPHHYSGMILLEQGLFPEARAELLTALQLDPNASNNSEIYGNLGYALFQQGNFVEAAAACRAAIDLKPSNHFAYYYLARCFEEQGDFKNAAEAFRKAISFDPNEANAYYHLGCVLEQSGDSLQSAMAYREAARLDPSCAGCHFMLGLSLDWDERSSEAVSALAAALALRPDEALIEDWLTRALEYRRFQKKQVRGNGANTQPVRKSFVSNFRRFVVYFSRSLKR